MAKEKRCRLCKKIKSLDKFGTFLDKKKGWVAPKRYVNSRCKSCASKVSSEYNKVHRKKITQKLREERELLLEEIRNHYGGACNCCGEKEPIFLTIDHINNDGYKERTRNGGQRFGSNWYYKRIIKQGFPKDLQLLCYNCNCGRARNTGICPHKK